MKAKGWLKLNPAISYGYADTNRPDSIQSMHRLVGFPIMSAIKDVVDGIQCVNGFFKKKKLFIHRDNVPNMLRELESYSWKSKPGKVFDEPIKENDHNCDALRYCLFTRERSRVRMVNTNPFRR